MPRASGSPLPDRLILVRHGATAWNAEGRFTTRTDVELSPSGRDEAAAAAQGLAGIGIERVMCSPLLRARATGEAIAAVAPGPPAVTIDERLREIDAGPFEGLTGAETYESAVARARSFFGDVRDLPGTTLAATHGSLARVLVTAVILGIDPGLHRRMWLDHCHCAVVALDESPPRLVALNVDARNIGV